MSVGRKIFEAATGEKTDLLEAALSKHQDAFGDLMDAIAEDAGQEIAGVMLSVSFIDEDGEQAVRGISAVKTTVHPHSCPGVLTALMSSSARAFERWINECVEDIGKGEEE